MSSQVANDVFKVIFPKYSDLLTENVLPSNESIEIFLREQLPRKVEMVRNMESCFNAFLLHFTNTILKRPQHNHIVHSLSLKASDKIQKYFHTLSLTAHKLDQNSLKERLSHIDLQQIKKQFKGKLQNIQELIREKYLTSQYIEKQCEEEIVVRLYILLQIYHFLKGDPVTAAGKLRLKQQDVLWAISKNQQPLDISELIVLDSNFMVNVEETVNKRCRPFINKRDLLQSKIKQILREGQSKIGTNFNLLIDSMISKQRLRIGRQVTASLASQLNEIQQGDEEAQAKELINQVQLLKRQFSKLKNTTYYLDIIRGNFSQKYKMQVNRLENVFYLTNLEKYLQDVSTFLEKVLGNEQRVINNRREYMRNFSGKIQCKISDLISYFENKSGQLVTLSDVLSQQFELLESALYGVVNRQTNNNYSMQSNKKNDYRRQKEDQRRIQMQIKAEQQKKKRSNEQERMEEKRRNEEQRLRRAREQREEKQKKRRQQNQRNQRQRKLELQKKRQEKMEKDQQQRRIRQQQMRKRQQEKKQRDEIDRQKRQELMRKKADQEQQNKKLKQFQLRKKQEERRRILQNQEEDKKRKQAQLKERKKAEEQQRNRRQQQRKNQQQRIKRQKQQKQVDQRRRQQQRVKQQKQKREREQRQAQSRKKQDEKMKQDRQKREREQKQAQEKRKKQEKEKIQNQRKEKEKKENQEREKRQTERKLKEAEERKKQQERIKLQKQRKQKEQKQRQKKAEEDRLARQKQEKRRKEEDERARHDREKKQQQRERQQRQKIQRQRQQKQKNQRQKRQKEKQEKQKKQREKQQRQLKEAQQKQKLQNQRKQKEQREAQQKIRIEKQRKEKQLRQKAQYQRLKKQQQEKARRERQQKQKKTAANKKPEPKKSSGINYNDFDDIMNDDLQQMQKNAKMPSNGLSSGVNNELDEQYGDDFDEESPQKQQQIQTKELISPADIKCLNQYMKGTTYARKNKVNAELLNKASQYLLVFQEFVQNRKLFFFENAISKAVLDLGEELGNPDINEEDLKMSVQTIYQEILKAYEEILPGQQMYPNTRYVFPFSFQNAYKIKLIQMVPAHCYFNVVLEESLPEDQEIQNNFQGVIEALMHIFQLEGQAQLEDYVINEESKLVLGTFDKEMPCLLLLFAMHYEHTFLKQVNINQYTIERFFYTSHTIQPLYEVMKDNDQAIDQFFVKQAEKYANDKIKIQSIQVSSSDQSYGEKLTHSALAIKGDFIKGKNTTTLANFSIELQDQQGQLTDKIVVYFSLERSSPKAVINYFIVTKDPDQQENASTIFQLISEGDQNFEVNVYTDFTRHNCLSSYSDWALPLWAHVITKRKLSSLQAFRAMAFSMTPFYLAFKNMD